jgi:transcriptional regulator with XRE-family HTH domain
MKLPPYGVEIRKIRLDRGWKMLDLADALGKSVAYISATETGRKTPSDEYVLAVIDAMQLNNEEAHRIRRAAQMSRVAVSLDEVPEHHRPIVHSFVEKLKEMPDDKVLGVKKLLDLERRSTPGTLHIQKEDLQNGFIVPALRTEVICQQAFKIRNQWQSGLKDWTNIAGLIECGSMIHGFELSVVEDELLDGAEACISMEERMIILPERIYRAAWMNEPRARFTLAHELAHAILHSKIQVQMASHRAVPPYRNSESQANTFAGAILMPQWRIDPLEPVYALSKKFGLSETAVRIALDQYGRSGLLTGQPGYPITV